MFHNSLYITILPFYCMQTMEMKHNVQFTLSLYNRPWRSRWKAQVQLYSFLNLGAWWEWAVKPRSDKFISGKETWYPLHRRFVGPQGRSGRVGKITPPQGFDPRTVQPVASRYTNWAIADHDETHSLNKQSNKTFEMWGFHGGGNKDLGKCKLVDRAKVWGEVTACGLWYIYCSLN